MSDGVTLLQSALETIRSENAETRSRGKHQMCPALILKFSQKPAADLHNENSTLSAQNTSLQQHNLQLLGQVSALNDQLAASQAQLVEQQTLHKNSFNGVKNERIENITEGRGGTTPSASAAATDVVPDGVNAAAELSNASPSGSVPKRRGRPRKAEVDGRSGSTADKCAATQKYQRPTAKRARAATKMSVTAADVPCGHENCQRPTGDPDWVTCSRCNRWYHDICLNDSPNHDNWVCGCS